MAPSAFYNRIIFNANAAGTGNFLVFTAVTGYRTPATAGVTDEKVVSYTAETADRTQWETGQGTYDVATTTVRRTTVRENNLGTTAIIDFATAPIVRLDLHAQDLHHPDRFVDVRDFGVVGDGFTDDTDGLQAAIDHAFNIGAGCVMIPDGFYCVVRKTIWLAKPGTYDDVDPQTGGLFTDYQYSMALVGGENLGNAVYDGVTIEAYGETGGVIDFSKGFPDYPILVVGPGQGMRVAGLTVKGASGSLFTTTFSPFCSAIAISGGPGGASRTMVERCWVMHAYNGIITGWNQDSLADSNTFIKCTAHQCHIGYNISNTQNYINELYSCNSGCTIGVQSILGKAVQIYGGNFSYAGAHCIDFDISGTTALSSVNNFAGTHLGRFTTTITFDPGDLFGFAENGFTDGGASNPIYNAYALETESFGVVPCQFASYNSATNALTLDLQEDWVYFNFGHSKDFTTTDLEAEIQACTILLGAQRVTAFKGTGINAIGPHLESPGSVFCLLDSDSGFQGAILGSIESPYFNFSATRDLDASERKVQSVWPIINLMDASLRIIGGQFGRTTIQDPAWLINIRGVLDLWCEKVDFYSPNVQSPAGGAMVANTVVYQTGTGGTGHWDLTPFVPTKPVTWVGSDGIGIGWVQSNRGGYPALGNLPEPGVTPELTAAFYDIVTAAAPITAAALGEYPIIHGGTLYRITSYNAATGTGGEILAVSDHQRFSYGQDFTADWSYKGQSNCLYVDDVGWFFPGLKIGLDNGGGVLWYIVTGVYPEEVSGATRVGYLTVMGASSGGTPTLLAGTSTVTYTGADIFQEEYDFTTIGAAAAPGGGGRTLLETSTTWYVATTGSDITGTGEVGAPWETLTFALNTIAATYELGTDIHTIQLADGTYAGGAAQTEFIGGGFLQILGNSSNVASVVLDGSLDSGLHSAFAFPVAQDAVIALADMTLISDLYLIRLMARCNLNLGYIGFGGDLAFGAGSTALFKIHCVAASANSNITDRTDLITITGNALGYIGLDAPIQCSLGENGGTTTMVGTPAFSFGTFYATSDAELDSYGTTFSGLATGKWWALESGALLITYDDGTLHYIPGDTEGTLTGGAVVTYRT